MFAKDVMSLFPTFESKGNSFLEDNGYILSLDTTFVMNKYAILIVNTVEEIGQRQFVQKLKTVSTLLVKRGKAASPVSLNIQIRRALREFIMGQLRQAPGDCLAKWSQPPSNRPRIDSK